MTELNATTGAVIQWAIDAGGDPISSDGTHVWVANEGENMVTELSASNGAVVQTIPVSNNPYAISSDGTHVWVTNWGDNMLTELSASTGAVRQFLWATSPTLYRRTGPTSGWQTKATTR